MPDPDDIEEREEEEDDLDEDDEDEDDAEENDDEDDDDEEEGERSVEDMHEEIADALTEAMADCMTAVGDENHVLVELNDGTKWRIRAKRIS